MKTKPLTRSSLCLPCLAVLLFVPLILPSLRLAAAAATGPQTPPDITLYQLDPRPTTSPAGPAE